MPRQRTPERLVAALVTLTIALLIAQLAQAAADTEPGWLIGVAFIVAGVLIVPAVSMLLRLAHEWLIERRP